MLSVFSYRFAVVCVLSDNNGTDCVFTCGGGGNSASNGSMLFVYTLRSLTRLAGRCIALSTYGKSPGTGSGRGNADVSTSSLGAVSGRDNADVTTSSLDGGGRVGGRGNADISTSSLGGGYTG